MNSRRSIVALVLLVPAPSIGVLAGMILFPGTRLGMILFALSKVWLFGLPLVWHRWVEQSSFSLSPARRGGFGMGVISGVLLSAVILSFFVTLGGRLMDVSTMAGRIVDIGLGSPLRYAAGALYWVSVNSVLEEYVWRWFCVKQCRTLFPGPVAVILSALFFTLHHTLALSALLPVSAVLLCSTGVFVGGAVWSGMYMRYQSVWPGYLSHAIVDVAIFGIGAFIAFG